MKATLIERTPKTFVLVFDRGDAVMATLQGFAASHGLDASRFSAIGALSDAMLGFYDWKRKSYTRIAVDEQVEVLMLAGNITRGEDGPKVHAHIVLGKSDGTAHGGHFMEGHVRPTLEVVLVESPRHLARHVDETTGLTLIDADWPGSS